MISAPDEWGGYKGDIREVFESPIKIPEPTGVFHGALYQPPKPTQPTQADIPDIPTGGGGGIVMTGIHIPSSIEEAIESTTLTPAFGGAGAVTYKLGGRLLIPAVVGAAGFLGGLLFGGSGSQEQDQDITQTPTVTPDQTTDVNPFTKQLLDILNSFRQNQTQTPDVGDIGGGGYTYVTGAVGSPQQMETIYNITAPYTSSIMNTITKSYQSTTTVTGATQEATQKQGLDLLTLAILGGVAFLVLGGVKK